VDLMTLQKATKLVAGDRIEIQLENGATLRSRSR
jgi:alkyl hydroperoxide reductase subunit AhpF